MINQNMIPSAKVGYDTLMMILYEKWKWMKEICKVQKQSLEWGVSRTFCGTDTSLTVSGGLVGKWELSKISSDHIELDFDGVENFSVVDSHEVTDHFGHNDAISKVSFDDGGFLTG